jgi:hypothetical protein
MFCAREISGLIAGALRERIRGQYRALKGGYMRSFRFPVWMIVLMLMLLLSVIVAIDKTLQVSTGSVNGGSTWLVLPGLIVFGVAFFGVVALIGYGLLYVLRKAGVQRLSDIQIPPHRN